MPLFVVQHTHDPAVCPAPNREVGEQLLGVLAAALVAGVTIHAEAVVDGEHELNMIVGAQDAATVEQFMQPFGQLGTVSVRQASACEQVVERGAC